MSKIKLVPRIRMRMRKKDVGKRLKVIGSYLFLSVLVFAAVGLFAFFQNYGNWFYLVAGIAVLVLFLWLCVKVDQRHQNTMYGLKDLR